MITNTIKRSDDPAFLHGRIDELNKEVEMIKSLVHAAKEVLNLEEAAAFLGVSKSMLYKMTSKKAIPFYRPNNKMVYFEKSELLAWLRRNPVASENEITELATSKLSALAFKD